jgi:hypothetical protein
MTSDDWVFSCGNIIRNEIYEVFATYNGFFLMIFSELAIMYVDHYDCFDNFLQNF